MVVFVGQGRGFLCQDDHQHVSSSGSYGAVNRRDIVRAAQILSSWRPYSPMGYTSSDHALSSLALTPCMCVGGCSLTLMHHMGGHFPHTIALCVRIRFCGGWVGAWGLHVNPLQATCGPWTTSWAFLH